MDKIGGITTLTRETPCPDCGATERIATLHCEPSSKSCVHTLECASCSVH